ncbi:MAG: hypothetical protein M3Y24_00195 [Acidobacteriota bacterium]|nr:hypothetical protein [Acidobacteriota bacterium]
MFKDDVESADGQMPLLVFVGGFLGAGKTTLIIKSAEMLREKGLRVGVITNDQDAGLVDTFHSQSQNFPTSEVAGGCFCCRFSDLLDAADRLAASRPQVIFAEPVGSCVDLSATILQPLLAWHSEAYRLAPLTVLLDPADATRLECGELHPDVEFLLHNQIAEADLLCLTKSDLGSGPPHLSFPIDFHLSARSGAGVEAWIDEVLASSRVVGAHLLDVDYGRYARAEAALGWLNLHADLYLHTSASPSLVVGPLLDRLESRLTADGIEITHLKLFDKASSGWIKVSISSNGAEPLLDGDLLAESSRYHQLVVNLRALADPEVLRSVVLRTFEELGGQLHIRHLGAFRPAAPVPEHRFQGKVR